MEMIDTHCHLTFKPLADQIDLVVQRSLAAGVTGWVTVGTDPDHWQKAIELAGRFPGMVVAAGIHPHEAGSAGDQDMARLEQLSQSGQIIAIGETGLDFHYLHSSAEDQQRVFVRHLDLAARAGGLPLIVHTREAFDQTVAILDRYRQTVRDVVLHCFTGSADQAKTAIARGWYLSFSGVVTFKNAKALQEAARTVPLDRLLIETDCPYLSPEPVRRQSPNEPALMVHTARFVAGLHQMDPERFSAAVTLNARRFYRLG